MDILPETPRLRLRRFTQADADHLFALDNDPDVMRYINGGLHTPRAVIEETILPGFLQDADGHPVFGFWAAIEKATGSFLGWFSLRLVNVQEAVLGYRLHRAGWGRGFATEGARALIAKGFAESAIQRVSATTYQDNLASRRVMEKLGMEFVRAFRYAPDEMQADTFYSETMEVWDGEDVEYALTREVWEVRS